MSAWPDPFRWPHTVAFLRTYAKEQDAYASRAPTLAWAYGAAMDREERLWASRMERWAGRCSP